MMLFKLCAQSSVPISLTSEEIRLVYTVLENSPFSSEQAKFAAKILLCKCYHRLIEKHSRNFLQYQSQFIHSIHNIRLGFDPDLPPEDQFKEKFNLFVRNKVLDSVTDLRKKLMEMFPINQDTIEVVKGLNALSLPIYHQLSNRFRSHYTS